MHVQPESPSEERLGDQEPVRADDDRVDRLIPELRALGLDDGDAEAFGRFLRRRRRERGGRGRAARRAA